MGRAPRFYLESPLAAGEAMLADEEARHAAAALRLQPGDRVELFDGSGKLGKGEISRAGREGMSVQVTEVTEVPEAGPRITLATAIPKGKRWQMLVEKCTELGVAAIRPVRFARSVAEGAGDGAKWRRWAVEACKQCGRLRVPEFYPATEFAELPLLSMAGPCLFGDAEGEPLLKWGGQLDRAAEALIAIGPEGGLTGEEEEALLRAGFAPVALGNNILRVETAAMAACALAAALL